MNAECGIVVKLNEICRVCLLQTKNMVPLSVGGLAEKLADISRVQIEINEVLPAFLCEPCQRKVLSFYAFQKQCQNSNTFIMDCVKQSESACQERVDVDEVHVKEEPLDPDDENACFLNMNIKTEPDEPIEVYEAPRPIVVPCRDEDLTKHPITEVNAAFMRFQAKLRIPKLTDCLKCGRKSKNTSTLMAHIYDAHKEIMNRWCSQCNEVFDDLKEHGKTHIFNGFICDFCGQNYASVNLFKEHLFKHTEHNHRCRVCSDGFNTKEQLLAHYRTHACEDKPFKCVCERAFSTKKALNVHAKMHKQLRCSICEEMYYEGFYEKHHCFSNIEAAKANHNSSGSSSESNPPATVEPSPSGEPKQRTYLNFRTKAQLLSDANRGCGVNYLSQKYGVSKSTVHAVRTKRAKINSIVASTLMGKRKNMLSSFPVMEHALYEWYVEQTKQNISVTGAMLKEQARMLHNRLKENQKNFHPSPEWMQRFKTRRGIRLVHPAVEEIEDDSSDGA